MKSQGLQELVKKIFGDEAAKSAFLSNPSDFISEFNLTEPEKRAVLTTHARLGLVASGSGQLEATIKGNQGWLSPVQ